MKNIIFPPKTPTTMALDGLKAGCGYISTHVSLSFPGIKPLYIDKKGVFWHFLLHIGAKTQENSRKSRKALSIRSLGMVLGGC